MSDVIHNPAGNSPKTNYRLWSLAFLTMAILCFLTSTFAESNYPIVNISIPENGTVNDVIWAGNIASAMAMNDPQLLSQVIQVANEHNAHVIVGGVN